MALHIVTGSPGCGKSTWVRRTAKPSDIQIGSDELTNALTGKTEAKHHHDQVAKKISKAAREAAITEAIKHRRQVDVWILISNLTEKDTSQWRKYGARFVVIDPGYDIAMQRCKANRPGYKHRLIDSWYSRRGEWPRGAEIIDPGVIEESSQEPENMPATKHGGATIRVVTGPPASGKSTFVRTHRKPGDVTIDFDTLANELAGVDPANHEHPQHIKTITKKARQAAIDAAITQAGDHTVWIIHSSPSEKLLDHYQSLGAIIDVVDPGKDIVMKRVKAERPSKLIPVAALWYSKHAPQGRKGTTERGYGWHDHQKPREALLRRHRDGTPCWWCGLPMYKDKQKNWDKKALARDHLEANGALNRSKLDRLLHGNCNSQRQDGRNDHIRPAVTNKHPSEPIGGRAPTGEAPGAGFSFGGVTFAT
ncbi:AAA family ATPase [Corynebacterium glutamicum]|uniref:AAA family ATPase n=1 Tax=Corynebacterium glutamicum TaxID=1718 RepID=UPI0007448B5E|nr:hypothetical protein [Corynebacterium glutamicum]AMA00222.1 hypothetical protein APT58_08285 [Corynebacterium glutamicum]